MCSASASWHVKSPQFFSIRGDICTITRRSAAIVSCKSAQMCFCNPLWRHDMRTVATLLALCGGNHRLPVDSFSHKVGVIWSFGVYFILANSHLVEATMELSVIWHSMSPMWCPCNVYSFFRTQDSGLRQNLFNMNIYSIAIHQVYTSMSI